MLIIFVFIIFQMRNIMAHDALRDRFTGCDISHFE